MNASPEPADSVIEARWVIPVTPAGVALEDHAVVIRGGRIVDVTPVAQARERYPDAGRRVLSQHALIPGLINLHTHAAMTLMRGLADDLRLMDWLNQHVWPTELRHVSDEFVYDGTRLACAEMLLGGITYFSDMYFFPEAAARATLDSRMRSTIGMIVLEFPSKYASDAQDYLQKGLQLRDSMRSRSSLVRFCFAPHAPYTVSDRSLAQVATYASELDLPVHMHVHETLDEINESLKAHNKRPLARLRELGLLGPGLIAVHAVHVDADEIALLASHGCHVAHCPSSNLKLASGIAPTAALLSAGVNIGLGTDGAASNNRLDVFAEMRLAALLAKGQSTDPTVLPASQALELATLGSARALGMEQETGSITAGKIADLTAVRMDDLCLSPCYDVISHLVYACGREHVSDVWVNGDALVHNGELTHIDGQELTAVAARWKQRIRP